MEQQFSKECVHILDDKINKRLPKSDKINKNNIHCSLINTLWGKSIQSHQHLFFKCDYLCDLRHNLHYEDLDMIIHVLTSKNKIPRVSRICKQKPPTIKHYDVLWTELLHEV